MGAILDPSIQPPEEVLALSPRLQPVQQSGRTRRIAELEAIVDSLRAALKSAEEELERERTRPPAIGDFVRCPLTNFFGRVTKVVPRPQGRPWVEITPYLTKDLPGHGTMDLFDSWELIDAPEAGEPPVTMPTIPVRGEKLPSVSSFSWGGAKAAAEDEQLAGEIEDLLGELWSEPGRTAR